MCRGFMALRVTTAMGSSSPSTCALSLQLLCLDCLRYRLPEYAHMLKPLLKCSQKLSMCTASVHLHRWLVSGSCITENPEEADLFYFPAYEACYNETTCAGTGDTERCFPSGFEPKDLPYFQRRAGQDHIFVFGCNLLPFMDSISISARNSIMLTVESFQEVNVAGPNMLAWLVYSKDVLIPGYIPAWRVKAMLAYNRPMIQRSILATFHGHSRKSVKVGAMYNRSLMSEVRDRIISYFSNQSGCSAGPPVRDYFRRSGLSRFCLIPAGLTAWTIHLYEAFFFGFSGYDCFQSDHLVTFGSVMSHEPARAMSTSLGAPAQDVCR